MVLELNTANQIQIKFNQLIEVLTSKKKDWLLVSNISIKHNYNEIGAF